MNIAIESLRQKLVKFRKVERIWKKKVPKGKKYVGYKFVPYKDKSKEGWVGMGWTAKPVYKQRRNSLN